MVKVSANSAAELRKSRRTFLAEIVQKDLQQAMPYRELLAQWSLIADQLVDAALKIVLKDFKTPPKFCVVALGKLGGLELNYSSDIDVIYIYDGDFEAAAKIAGRLTKLLNDVTDDGFVYRVDTNLRPDGNRGPLVNTVDTLERYYETAGHEWERQALVRARVVCGDLNLGEEFVRRVRPFVYRRSMDISALKKIRASKMAIEKTASSEGGRNIKLGPGGIREAEFFVQAMQMLHGGAHKELRTTNTFDALDELLKFKLIQPKKHAELLNSYTLLRRTENLLQARDDRQTHTIPKTGEALLALANNLGFKCAENFIAELERARKNIQNHFSTLFESSYEKLEIIEAMEANLETCANKEELIDSLPWFKNHIMKRIQELDLNGKINMDDVSERLISLAETIISQVLKFAEHSISTNYGTARDAHGKTAEIAVIGMGKLGTFEMDYGSDLDLVFIYSENGETDGSKKITNHEYFTKIAQSTISNITLPTRYGRTYNIDAELRPSGNQGPLVTSFEAFERYHLMEAGLWERQALLRARVVTGPAAFADRITEKINELTFERELPHDLKAQIDTIRKKVAFEKKSPRGHIDMKYGTGGITDIETVIHYLQLAHGTIKQKIRCKRLGDAIDILHLEGILDRSDQKILVNAYKFYRQILSRTRLFVAHTGTFDPNADYAVAVVNSLDFGTKEHLMDEIKTHQMAVQEVYKKYLLGK